MSLPPQILRIKRKLVDEPVDSLYLDPEQQRTKRRLTTSGIEFVFKRIVEQPMPVVPTQKSSTGIPQVIATQPGEENDYIQRWRQRPRDGTILQSQRSTHSSASLPRRFHLSRNIVPAVTTLSAGKKNRKLQGETNVAIFVEDHTIVARPTASDSHYTAESDMLDSSSVDSQSLTPIASPKKRPRTPATPSRPLDPVPQSDSDTVSAMHEALQKFAAEELGAPQLIQEPNAAHSGTQNFSDGTWNGPDGDAMDVSEDQRDEVRDDESLYQYDTYMRYAHAIEDLPNIHEQIILDGTHSSGGKTVMPPDVGSFGYLVIPEADQTLWETFYASDASSDSEAGWDSEEDDENHENYYGADYPEDEVSSEDDRNENPYRYMRGSGDEGSGSDDETWSDEEA